MHASGLLQVKMWKDLEEQRKKEELDPAKEAGSAIFELAGNDTGVQRLRAPAARTGKGGRGQHVKGPRCWLS